MQVVLIVGRAMRDSLVRSEADSGDAFTRLARTKALEFQGPGA